MKMKMFTIERITLSRDCRNNLGLADDTECCARWQTKECADYSVESQARSTEVETESKKVKYNRDAGRRVKKPVLIASSYFCGLPGVLRKA